MFINLDDLIVTLQKAKANHGNLPVRVCLDETKSEFTSITMVNVFDSRDNINPPQGDGDHVWISLHGN